MTRDGSPLGGLDLNLLVTLRALLQAEGVSAAAARLGQTAPGIAHMWHMPGHIYSKAKRYQDAIWHQQASARVDHAHMMKHFLLPDQIHNYAHNNEWLSRN